MTNAQRLCIAVLGVALLATACRGGLGVDTEPQPIPVDAATEPTPPDEVPTSTPSEPTELDSSELDDLLDQLDAQLGSIGQSLAEVDDALANPEEENTP